MKKIPLTRDKHALVDDEDYERLSKFSWHAQMARGGLYEYAVRSYRYAGEWRTRMMHWDILGVKWVDHINGNGLDNRRSNLRKATRSQNHANSRKWGSGNNRRTTSRYKGVMWDKREGRWRAAITVQGRRVHLGYHASELSAARAYDKAAVEHFGEFASVNLRVNAGDLS